MDNQQNKLMTTRNTVLWLILLINLILVLCALYLLIRGNKTDSDSVEQSTRATRQQHANGADQNTTLQLQSTRSEPVHKQTSDSKLQSKTVHTISNNQSSLAASNHLSITEQGLAHTGFADSESNQDTTVQKPDQNLISQQNTTPSTQISSHQTADTETNQYADTSTIITEKTTQKDKTVAQQKPLIDKTSVQVIEQPAKPDNQSVTVVKGDSLWDIAKDVYGSGFDYPLIFKANPDLNNPDIIEIGTVLQIPLKSDHPPH